MGILAGIERLCEATLEAVPEAGAEPLDLVRVIEREIRRNRRAFVNDRTYVPHGITVHFYTPAGSREEEYQALFDSDEFRDYLAKHIRQRGYRLAGDVRFAVRCHRERLPEFRRRPCFVEFSWPRANDENGRPAGSLSPRSRPAVVNCTPPLPASANDGSCGRRARPRAARHAIGAALLIVLSLCAGALAWKKMLPLLRAGAPPSAQAAALPPSPVESRPAQRAEQAAGEWARIVELEESPRGSYEDRIEALESFLRTYPGAPQAAAAAQKLSLWQGEQQAFLAAERLEQSPAARMSEILASWQAFLESERTGLRREHARERVRVWSERLADYAGYAELTIVSAHALPPHDAGILDSGMPDAYFVLLDGARVLHRSRTIPDSTEPAWNEKVRLFIAPDRVPVLEIRDEDVFGYEVLLRRALAPFPPDGPNRLAAGDLVVDLEIRRER